MPLKWARAGEPPPHTAVAAAAGAPRNDEFARGVDDARALGHVEVRADRRWRASQKFNIFFF